MQSIKERCDEAQREVESSENLIKDLNVQYDEIISWSSLYDSASIEAKKMIVNSMIKRVDVYRNYDLNIELNMNIRQFFLGMEESESIPITALNLPACSRYVSRRGFVIVSIIIW